eukprot:TRINITY_DN17944_c0_g1_i1.p1 TRINITY_DN17944_c0_g1~~TRINITY_DN17944_c0_g1_i1.p1  ORF type:complete len:305 (+),score=98.98 TRINITY_DN17944_c0_g1_i1:75-917(+)
MAGAPVPLALGPDAYPDNNITWRELAELGYEKPARGRVLYGDVAHKQTKYWPNSKQIKVRDAEGVARAVFFYPPELNPPLDYDDITPGATICLRSPRLHRFMDGQDGLRVEDPDGVVSVGKRPLSDQLRFEYSGCAKALGNDMFKQQKYEEAVDQYRVALEYAQAADASDPELSRDLRVACHLNMAACAHGLKKYAAVEPECQAALADNPSCAKAHFRIGQAAAALANHAKAVQAFSAAAKLAPEDKKVAAELAKAQRELEDGKRRERRMWSGVLTGDKG